MNSIVANVLTTLLSDYIEDVNSKNLDIGLLSKKAVIKDTVIRKDIFTRKQLPFEVKNGVIGFLDLQIEELSKSLPMKIKLNDIFVLGKVRSDVSIQGETATIMKERTEFEALCLQSGVSQQEMISSSMANILDRLRVEINNIHIRIEFEQENTVGAFGVTIPKIEVISSESNNSSYLAKKLIIHELSIYMDSNTEMIQISGENRLETVNNFKKTMIKTMTNHSYILKDFTFECILNHRLNKGDGVMNIVNINSGGFDLMLNEIQYKCLLEINKEHSKFRKIMYFAHLGRPTVSMDSPDMESQWFMYGHLCARKKVDPFSFNVKNALSFLKNRKKMVEPLTHYIQSSKKESLQSKIKKYEKIYGPTVMILFATYTQRQIMLNQKLDVKVKIDKKELQKMVEERKDNYNISSFQLMANVDDIHLSLFKNEKDLLTKLQFIGMDFSCQISDALYMGYFMLKEINLLDHGLNKILYFENRLKLQNCIAANFSLDQTKQTAIFTTKVASPIINIDVPFFFSLADFFNAYKYYTTNTEKLPQQKVENPFKLTELQIQHLIDTKYMLNLECHMDTPTIILPADQKIIIETGSLDIKSERKDKPVRAVEESLYDNYTISLNNFAIKMDNEFIMDPSSTSISIKTLFFPLDTIINQFVDVSMSSIDFKLKRTQYFNFIALIEKYAGLFGNKEASQQKAIDYSKQSQPMTLSKNISAKIKTHFTEFSFKLLKEDCTIENQFNVNNLDIGSTIRNGRMDTNFVLSSVLAMTGDNEPFCSFGSDQKVAVVVDLKLIEDVLDMKVVSHKPFILLDFRWISQLTAFFTADAKPPSLDKVVGVLETQMKAYEQKEETKVVVPVKKENNIKFKAAVEVYDPIIIGKTTKVDGGDFDAKFEVSSVIVGLENESVNCQINEIQLLVNGRHILDPLSGNVLIKLGEDTVVDCCFPVASLNCIASDYNLAMDTVEYATSYITYAFSSVKLNNEPKEKKSNTIVNVSIPCVNIGLNEGEKKLIQIVSKGFTFNMKEEMAIELSNISMTTDREVIKIDSLKFVDDTLTISDNTEIDLTKDGLGTIFPIFVAERVPIFQKVEQEKPKGKEFVLKMNIGSVNGRLFKEETKIADVSLKSLIGSVTTGCDDGVHINMKFGALTMMKSQEDAYKIIEYNDEISFIMAGNSLNFEGSEIFATYDNDFFMNELLPSITDLFAKPTDLPGAPSCIAPFKYNAKLNKATLNILPRDDPNNGLKCSVYDVSFTTLDNCMEFDVKYSKIDSDYIKSSNGGAHLALICSNEVPPVTKYYSEDDRKIYEDKSKNFLHGVSILVNLEEISYDFNKKSASLVAGVGSSFLPTEFVKAKFQKTFKFGINIASTAIKVLGGEISIDNISFSMDEGMSLLIGLIKYENLFVRLLSLNMSKNSVYVKITKLTGDADIYNILSIVNEIYGSAFMTTKFGVADPDEVKEEISFDFFIKTLNFAAKCIPERKRAIIVRGEVNVAGRVDAVIANFSNVTFGFLDSLETRNFSSVIDGSVMTFQKTDTTISYVLSDSDVNICINDIVSLYLMITKIIKMIPESINENYSVEVVDDYSQTATKYIVSVGKINLFLNYANNCPFMKVGMDPVFFNADFEKDDINVLNVNFSKVIVFNNLTQMCDVLLDNFSYNVKFRNYRNVMNIDFNSNTPISLSISRDLIKRATDFVDMLTKKIEEKSIDEVMRQTIVVKNNTEKVLVVMNNDSGVVIEPQGMRSLDKYNVNTPLTCMIDDKKNVVKYSDLLYPFFFDGTVICYASVYKLERHIVFSMPVVFKNTTDFELLLQCIVNDEKVYNVCTIPKQSSKALPYGFPIRGVYRLNKGTRFSLRNLVDTPIEVNFGNNTCILSPRIANVKEITIFNNSVFINCCPVPIYFTDFNIPPTKLEKDKTVGVAINRLDKSMYMAASLTGSMQFTPSEISLVNEGTYAINCEENNMALNVTMNSLNQYVFKFFVQSIAVNDTPFNLYIGQKHGKSFLFPAGQEVYINESEFVPMLSNSIEQEPIVNGFINVSQQVDSEIYFIYVNNKVVIPLRYKVEKYNSFTNKIVFRSAVVVRYLLPFKSTFYPMDDKSQSFELVPDSINQVQCTDICMRCVLNIDGTEIVLDLGRVNNTTIIYKGKLISLAIENINNQLVATLKPAKGIQPLMIKNITRYFIRYGQATYPETQKCLPISDGVVAFDSPSSGREITLKFFNNENEEQPIAAFTSDFGKLTEINVGGKLIFAEIINNRTYKVLCLTNAPLPPRTIPSFAFNFNIRYLQVSLIDKFKECYLLTLTGINLTAKTVGDTIEGSASIRALNFDDLHPLAVFDNVISSKSFLNLKFSMRTDAPLFTVFEYIDLSVSPILLFLDNSFICDIYQYFEKIKKRVYQRDINKITADKYDASGSTPYILKSKRITVHAIDIKLTHEKNTSRPTSSLFPPITLLLIPTISNATARINQLNITDFESTGREVNTKIIKPLLNNIKKKVLNILINTDMLLNIGKVGSSFKKNVLGGTLRVGENVLNTAGSVLRTISTESSLTGTKRNRAGLNESGEDTMLSGLKSLGEGLIDGVSGVILDPINAAKTGGAEGFFKGVGTGVVGLFAKPVLGVIDAANGVISGSRKIIENDNNVYHKQRLPMMITMKTVGSYDEYLSVILNNLQMSSLVDGTYNEQAEFIFNIRGVSNANTVVLSRRAIYFFMKARFVERFGFNEIRSVTISRNGVFMIDKSIKFAITNADIIQRIIHFLSTRVKVILN